MVLVVCFAFIVSWTPYFVVTMITTFQAAPFFNNNNFFFTMLCINLAGFINSCVNPFIYCIMSKRFRQAFLHILTCGRERNTSAGNFRTSLSEEHHSRSCASNATMRTNVGSLRTRNSVGSNHSLQRTATSTDYLHRNKEKQGTPVSFRESFGSTAPLKGPPAIEEEEIVASDASSYEMENKTLLVDGKCTNKRYLVSLQSKQNKELSENKTENKSEQFLEKCGSVGLECEPVRCATVKPKSNITQKDDEYKETDALKMENNHRRATWNGTTHKRHIVSNGFMRSTPVSNSRDHVVYNETDLSTGNECIPETADSSRNGYRIPLRKLAHSSLCFDMDNSRDYSKVMFFSKNKE